MDLEGKATLLTGASGPTGQTVARALAAKGAALKVSGRNADALEALRRELPRGAEVLAGNLASAGDAHALAERAGAVDVLVSFAGISPVGPLESHPPDEIDRTLDVNLRAPIHLARALLPGMIERGHGHLVFVSSISGKSPSRGRSLYSAPCYALRGFAGCLRADLHDTGIGVTTVLPGPIRTPGDDERPQSRLDLPPERVAGGIVRGIERNRREVLVVPWFMRVFLGLAAIAPALLARTGPDPDE